MKKEAMKEKKHNVSPAPWTFVATLVVAVALIVGGFLVPPTGIIDGSVLTAVGELSVFGALAQLPALVGHGRSIRLQHHNTTLSVGQDNSREEDYDPC